MLLDLVVDPLVDQAVVVGQHDVGAPAVELPDVLEVAGNDEGAALHRQHGIPLDRKGPVLARGQERKLQAVQALDVLGVGIAAKVARRGVFGNDLHHVLVVFVDLDRKEDALLADVDEGSVLGPRQVVADQHVDRQPEIVGQGHQDLHRRGGATLLVGGHALPADVQLTGKVFLGLLLELPEVLDVVCDEIHGDSC